MENIEKHIGDTILFPAFNLNVSESKVIAIHSTLNVRQVLIEMFLGKVSSSSGNIRINDISISNNKTAYFSQIGIAIYNDGLYERLTVLDHLKFYFKLYDSEQELAHILQITQLENKKHMKIVKLSYSEQRRVQFARILLHNPALYIFEEPDLNVDMETKRVLFNIIKQLKETRKAVVVLTGNMETGITISDQLYRLDEKGLCLIEMKTEVSLDVEQIEEKELNEQIVQFNKIPTKVNEKILLFDPPEIDYIESNDGQAHIYVKGESFSSMSTLADLEKRLQPYGFFRCHRSYIVNLQKVREVITWTRNSYSLILDDSIKSSIPLSKTKMTQLKEILGLK